MEIKQKSNDFPQNNFKIFPNQDDYGMKNIVTAGVKAFSTWQNPRKNQFCSHEAQAIIEKVKMRQKNKNNSCRSHNENSMSCRGEILLQGSRASQDSL